MSRVIEKRITQSGSGAYAIYLPKRWVESKTGQGRNIQLVELDNHLVITPVPIRSELRRRMASSDLAPLEQFILSSYIRGYTSVEVTSDRFTDEQIGGAHTYMRLLDESLVPKTRETMISFEKRDEMSYPREYEQCLRLLFDRVIEDVELCVELVRYFPVSQQRAVHILKMIHSLEKGDIDRLTYQIFRVVVNMEQPVRAFADQYFTGWTASLLERIGDIVYDIAGFVCALYGFDREDLNYPLQMIREERIRGPFDLPASLHRLVDLYVELLHESVERLQEAKGFVMARDGAAAYAFKGRMELRRTQIEGRLIDETGQVPHATDAPGEKTLYVQRIGFRLLELIRNIESLGKRTSMFYFCEGEGGDLTDDPGKEATDPPDR